MSNDLPPETKHQLDIYLNNHIKNSRHLRGMLDSQRSAFAQSLAIIFKYLSKDAPDIAPLILNALQEIELPTGHPSIDSDRSLIARSIREEMSKDVIHNASELNSLLFGDTPSSRSRK